MTREVIWPLMELMGSTSPSSYSVVLGLDRKIRELSAAVSVHEEEQFNTAGPTVEWSCILGANARQAGECLFFSSPFCLAVGIRYPVQKRPSPFFHLNSMTGNDPNRPCIFVSVSSLMDTPSVPIHGSPPTPGESV